MKRVLLVQLDGKLPNVALMRASAHHKALGDSVTLKQAPNRGSLKQAAWSAGPLTTGERPDLVYGSLIFDRSRHLAEALVQAFPESRVVLGGTGWNVESKLEDFGITTKDQDYSIYPDFTASIGFTQRGCRLRCPFCVVPRKEGKIAKEVGVQALWRGGDHPRHLLLLDNDFFGQPDWIHEVDEIVAGKFKVCFAQGINSRLLNDESAAAIARMDYRDDSFKVKRIYTAWDNRKDEDRLFSGLEALKRHGVKPDHVMVYMLIGYWPGETIEDRLYRQAKLRAWGARPYPMPFVRSPELVGFQRWVIGAYDKKIPWDAWVQARYQPRNLVRACAPSDAR